MKNIIYTSAGAGSGKTFNLTLQDFVSREARFGVRLY